MGYFDKGLFEFLTELKQNNDRDWFNKNKSRFEQHQDAADERAGKDAPVGRRYAGPCAPRELRSRAHGPSLALRADSASCLRPCGLALFAAVLGGLQGVWKNSRLFLLPP